MRLEKETIEDVLIGLCVWCVGYGGIGFWLLF